MRIHYLQHVPFENLATIENRMTDKNYPITCTRFFADEKLPSIEKFDWLFVMGGPMNIYEEDKYPWLIQEKKFIKQAIQANKTVVGICLGAQLIANVLGAKVYPNQYKEIGWHPVALLPEAEQSKILENFPTKFTTFQWHGDTFDLPAGCQWLAKSDVCAHQAFSYGEKVIALQFHLESSRESIGKLIKNCGDELVQAPYIQTEPAVLLDDKKTDKINRLMVQLLENLEK